MGICLPKAAALKYRADMLLHYPLLVDWGICSCRYIAGTTTWSQHSYGNAVDLHPLTTAYGDRAASYVRANAARLGIAHLLWQVPDHYDHLHADFNPQYSGTPACSGGADTVASSVGSSRVGTAKTQSKCKLNALTRAMLCNPLTSNLNPAARQLCADCKDVITQETGTGTLDLLKIGLFENIASYLAIAAGGVIMLAGLAVVLVAVTGQQNKVAAVTTRRLRPVAAPARAVRARSGGRPVQVAVPPRPDTGGARRATTAAREEAAEARREARFGEEMGRQQVRRDLEGLRRARRRQGVALSANGHK